MAATSGRATPRRCWYRPRFVPPRRRRPTSCSAKTSRPRLARASRKRRPGASRASASANASARNCSGTRSAWRPYRANRRPCRARWPPISRRAREGDTSDLCEGPSGLFRQIELIPFSPSRSKQVADAVGAGEDQPVELVEPGQGGVDGPPIGRRTNAESPAARSPRPPTGGVCSASGSCGSAGRVTITRVPNSGRSVNRKLFTFRPAAMNR